MDWHRSHFKSNISYVHDEIIFSLMELVMPIYMEGTYSSYGTIFVTVLKLVGCYVSSICYLGLKQIQVLAFRI